MPVVVHLVVFPSFTFTLFSCFTFSFLQPASTAPRVHSSSACARRLAAASLHPCLPLSLQSSFPSSPSHIFLSPLSQLRSLHFKSLQRETTPTSLQPRFANERKPENGCDVLGFISGYFWTRKSHLVLMAHFSFPTCPCCSCITTLHLKQSNCHFCSTLLL